MADPEQKQKRVDELAGKHMSSSQIGLVRLGGSGEVLFDPLLCSPLFAIKQNPHSFLALYREMTQAIINYRDLIKEGKSSYV